MHDPMRWALPVFRAFGIPVKVHVFFFIITIGLFLRQVFQPGNVLWWGDVLLFTVFLLFFTILLHEFGHCFGGRWVDGDAREILIWPLGGLAKVDIPHLPRAHLITVAAGPAVNLILCVMISIVILAAGFLPNFNPLSNPYEAELKNYMDGRTYSSVYGLNLYKSGTAERVEIPVSVLEHYGDRRQTQEAAVKANLDWAVAPTWLVWLYRWFWLNWVLLLFNLLPAYPLDGGQLLQGFIWSRTDDYRRGVVVAAYTGFVVALLFLVAAITINEALLLGLGLFMFFCCSMQLQSPETEENPFGYDFSAGYTSLEKDDPPEPKRRRGNFIKRWLAARTARRLQREIQQRQQEDERMDQLLDKIAHSGKESLTDEERKFMERVSERYRNRSS